MNLIIPPRLNKGDTIGIFSPSTPASTWIDERTQLTLAFMEQKGYRIKPGSLFGHKDHYRSGSIRARADELNELIADPEVKCIMAVAGGFVSNSILPYVDYNALREHPKIIVGYSDITAVLLSIYRNTGMITFYGPNLISTFGERPPFSIESLQYFEEIVCGQYTIPYVFPTPSQWTDDSIGIEEEFSYTMFSNELLTLREGCVSGRIIGGNLNTMLGFFGTRYMPEIGEGDILYLEDTRQYPESIERSFSLLENAGVFEKIGGLILGKHADYNSRGSGLKSWEVPMEILGKYKFPILAEFDCSHTRPMLTMPISAEIQLDSTQKTVTLLQDVVE